MATFWICKSLNLYNFTPSASRIALFNWSSVAGGAGAGAGTDGAFFTYGAGTEGAAATVFSELGTAFATTPTAMT